MDVLSIDLLESAVAPSLIAAVVAGPIGNTLLREKLLAGIGGAVAFLGLLLAAIGLSGLLNYSGTRRTKEIGIRAALALVRHRLFFLS